MDFSLSTDRVRVSRANTRIDGAPIVATPRAYENPATAIAPNMHAVTVLTLFPSFFISIISRPSRVDSSLRFAKG